MYSCGEGNILKFKPDLNGDLSDCERDIIVARRAGLPFLETADRLGFLHNSSL